MSTRATYQIAGGYDNAVNPTFYIHHDGYLDGAAFYLDAMLKRLATSKGGYAEAFLRANDGAELTPRHNAHGDTEYRYTLRRDGWLTVHERRYNEDPAVDAWPCVSVGPVWAFINAHPRYIEKFERWVQVVERQWMTESQAAAALDLAQRELDSYRERFPQYTGNISYLEQEAARKRAHLDKIRATLETADA